MGNPVSNDLAMMLLTREAARQCPSLMDKVRVENSTGIIFTEGTPSEHIAILLGLLEQARLYDDDKARPLLAAADCLLAHMACVTA